MPRARKHIVCLTETPYYHVTARCVRRAFLCGVDRYSGNSYEHRRAWVEDRIRVLASIFYIDLCAYSVMSNHYHLVIRLQTPPTKHEETDDEVLNRWTTLFRGPLLVQRYRDGEALSCVERESLQSIANVYRNRLHSLSWFMKCLNEPIARKANAEDNCTGHFWESRFHSQPLRTEKALLTAMAYVDLNPIRARVASTPEQSDYTSIQARLKKGYQYNTLAGAVARLLATNEINHFETEIRPLMSFTRRGEPLNDEAAALPMYEADYFTLVDATGRCDVPGRKGAIGPDLLPILQRLGLSAEQWTSAATAFSAHYRNGDLRLKKQA